MLRLMVVLLCLLPCLSLFASEQQKGSLPSFDYEVARAHEIVPHRRTIPITGVGTGFNQLHLKLTVSATGDVTHAEASGEEKLMRLWPQVEGEVYQWKFTSFEQNGRAVTAEVEEYLDLVPQERMPKVHVKPPTITKDSKIEIVLERSGCYGSCPSYTVIVTNEGIVFDGRGFVVARGRHTERVDVDAVRALAKQFVDADFYSMDADYRAMVTDMPGYSLSLSVDGQGKYVRDYVGQWVGMPAVITELEDTVDRFAKTKLWIEGGNGLVDSLKVEKFDFGGYDAQLILKETARRGQTETVRELLAAGIPLKQLPAPKTSQPYEGEFGEIGWLTAASRNMDVLELFLKARASKEDQRDKDVALNSAAQAGDLKAVRALIAYGADVNVDLNKPTPGTDRRDNSGAGSVLISAAFSGNPELVREILSHHPKLEARDQLSRTAIFAAGESRPHDASEARVTCVRLLIGAGADINASDFMGDTPLHVVYVTGVIEELLRLGADVNARNHDGETPIFTTVDDDAIPLFIKHGADLTIRNNKGETVMEAAKIRGPHREETLRKAMAGQSTQ